MTRPRIGDRFTRRAVLSRAGENQRYSDVRSTLSTDEPLERAGYVELLEHTEDAIDMTRAAEGLPLILNHGTSGDAMPVGRIEEIRLEEGRLRGVVRVSEATQLSRDVRALVEDAVLRDISIGGQIRQIEVEERDQAPDLIRITKWTPTEGSLATVGADPAAGIGRTHAGDEPVTQESARPRAVEDDPEAVRRQAIERAGETLIAGFPDLAPQVRSEVARATLAGTDPETFSAELLELSHQGEGESIGRVTAGADGIDRAMLGAERAILLRSNRLAEDERAEIGRNEFLSLDLPGIAREFMLRRGEDPAGMSRARIIQHELQRAVEGPAANTTATFPALLENVLRKSLASGFAEHPSTWQVWCQRGRVEDYKQFTRPGMSHFQDLAVVAENGEFLEGTITDKKEQGTMVKHGRRFSISDEALINDDLGAFSTLAPRMGTAAARLVDSLPYAVLTTNPAMTEDGETLFNNVQRTGSQANLTTDAISETAINDVRVSMVRKLDPNNIKIMPALTYLIHPPELTSTVEKLLNDQQIPVSVGSGATREHNTVSGRYTNVESAWLTDVNDWYGAAANDTIEMVGLDGSVEPQLERERGFKYDSVWFKVRVSAVALAVDYRGLHKAAVA